MQTASYYLSEAAIDGVKAIAEKRKCPASQVVEKALLSLVKRESKPREQPRKSGSI